MPQPREQLQAIATGHPQVDQGERRSVHDDHALGCRPVGCLADHGEPRVLVERPDDARAEQRVVVGHHDRERCVRARHFSSPHRSRRGGGRRSGR
jgi:hypothetical protein